ncbi:SET domain-containing protein [Roseateles violae]|uniref:SET domain-containing protein-lysine N-methyltransferase n=1 Tax=Roseateles violae TaxID=3058042 RepID=A0ABT8DTV7_9BURK|nr:SET domain-containing protein-lysine N-methyltransferase [Pelomonas sp. PFR6]MDN3921730.1 SET domain-containing protein-lysine N-methyltransferase [Pelomonas sp. PFR6]
MALAAHPAHQFVAVAVRRSRIDGFGVFAAEAIAAEAAIGDLTGEAVSVAEGRRRVQGRRRIMLVELSARRAIDATHSSDPMRFTNHSCRPNARIAVEAGSTVRFYALREIAVGEEITVDYGATHHEGQLACRCGQPGCIGWL